MRRASLLLVLLSVPMVLTFPAAQGKSAHAGSLSPTGAWAGVPVDRSRAELPVSMRPAIFDYLVGNWAGEGELFGRPSRFDMVWAWELGGRFVGLSYEIRGDVQMSARAHYRIADSDTISGVWVDSRGEILELRATATDSTLVTLWRSPTEQGRTIYRRSGADSLEVFDAVQDGAGWRRFGTAQYGRR